MKNFLASIGLIVLSVPLVVAMVVVRGFVAAALWQWFLVPLGVPAVGIIGVIGVGLCVSYLLNQAQKEVGWKDLIAGPAIVYFVGWFLHLYI